MTILIFILVLVALILVHELGHFIVAKLSGMRVDEFGIGYPPRVATLGKAGGTTFTLNWLPFGGFVKIYGEDGEERGPGSFASRPRYQQALVLVAGVAMNLLFAYVLITGALLSGTPRALADTELVSATETRLIVANILPGSPADEAGLLQGDRILGAEDGHFRFEGIDPREFTAFVAEGNGNATVAIDVKRATGETETLFARPEKGIISGESDRAALGIEVVPVGVVPISFVAAITEGAKLTWTATALTARGLAEFFMGVFTFSANLSQVAGPVGIAGVVGTASAEGLGSLLSIMAIISINLALINLIPIPALDGGRLLFVAIESVTRRPIKESVARAVNAAGFAFLILLMVAVTVNDIFRIVH